VQHRDVVVLAGLGMPPEQVVMMRANLTLPVVVANVVKIRLGKRHAEEPQSQEDDPESPQASLCQRPPQGHAQASLKKKSDQQLDQ
jgi:hypothetical protein